MCFSMTKPCDIWLSSRNNPMRNYSIVHPIAVNQLYFHTQKCKFLSLLNCTGKLVLQDNPLYNKTYFKLIIIHFNIQIIKTPFSPFAYDEWFAKIFFIQWQIWQINQLLIQSSLWTKAQFNIFSLLWRYRYCVIWGLLLRILTLICENCWMLEFFYHVLKKLEEKWITVNFNQAACLRMNEIIKTNKYLKRTQLQQNGWLKLLYNLYTPLTGHYTSKGKANH